MTVQNVISLENTIYKAAHCSTHEHIIICKVMKLPISELIPGSIIQVAVHLTSALATVWGKQQLSYKRKIISTDRLDDLLA